MNAEAEKEIARIVLGNPQITMPMLSVLVHAMEWAYADAAKVMRHGVAGSREYCQARLECADLIEARSK